jgi:ketosteroid isomerase-like protein
VYVGFASVPLKGARAFFFWLWSIDRLDWLTTSCAVQKSAMLGPFFVLMPSPVSAMLPRMNLFPRRILLLFTAFLALASAHAAEDPAHDELRALRTTIIDAIVKGDIDTVVKHVHPDVVVTWQNSEVCRGRQGLKDFFEKTGRESFKGYKLPPTPDDLTILHGGDTGISFGETIAGYKLLGKDYEIKSRWTATVVKVDGQWQLAAYHISMNVLDNPLLNTAKNTLSWAAGLAFLLGLAIGVLLGRWRKAKAS